MMLRHVIFDSKVVEERLRTALLTHQRGRQHAYPKGASPVRGETMRNRPLGSGAALIAYFTPMSLPEAIRER
jgi:hypothetical protein